jgi:cytochrome b561
VLGDIPVVQQRVTRSTDWALYALLMVQPILGGIAASAYHAPIEVFGLFERPPTCPEDHVFSGCSRTIARSARSSRS